MIGAKKKRIVFTDCEHQYANFKIRLRYDRLTQRAFFQFILRAYVDGDPEILPLIERCKELNKSMGKKKINLASSLQNKGKDLVSDLGLSETEKENIFDIIEQKRGKT